MYLYPAQNLQAWQVIQPPKRDVIQVIMSDMHSGSNYALFLSRMWHGTNNNTHFPRAAQIKIRERFELFADQINIARQGKRVKLIHNGDAIDGDHHNSNDVCTTNSLEQADIHVELMIEFQRRIGWQAGDEMYYTRGTQTHVNDFEEYIGKQLNAVPNGDFYVHDLLKLETNGVVSWFVHHGPGAGNGGNEGNALRNWLKTIYLNALKDGDTVPDIVYTGHVHNPTYAPLGIRLPGFVFKNMHGIICPSWQTKTKYALMKAPISKNRIGGVLHEIKADGTIAVPVFSVSVSD